MLAKVLKALKLKSWNDLNFNDKEDSAIFLSLALFFIGVFFIAYFFPYAYLLGAVLLAMYGLRVYVDRS